jgi:outer membrane protein assembly factor BamB
MKPRLPVVAVLGVAFAVLASACSGAANPEGWAAPVFDGSEVLLFLDKKELSAVEFNGSSATVIWTFPDHDLSSEEDIDLKSVYTEPIVDGDTVYLGSYDGDVYAISRADGRLRWSSDDQVSIKGSIVSGPVLDGGKLYFGTTEGFLYILNASDGSAAAEWPEGGVSLSNRGIWATPLVDGTTIYVGTMDGKLRALEYPSAAELWAVPVSSNSGAIAELSAASDDSLFVATLGKEVFIVDKATGTQVGASVPADGWVWTLPAVDAGVAYYGDFEGSLFALDITSGSVSWDAETDGRVKAGPAIVGEWVIFADESPAVSFVNRETGQVRNRVPIPDAGTVRANVVASDGVAYVVTTKGQLFKADPSNFSVVEIPIVRAS